MKPTIIMAAVLAVCGTSFILAQDAPMFPGPKKEHGFLKRFAGEWETHSEGFAGPDQPAMKCEGTIKAKMLGGLWVISEMESNAMGMKMSAVLTLGYDEKAKKYTGTWVDSMFNHLWKYDGTLDKTGRILTLAAEGPNIMEGGKMAKFRDIYEFKSQDEIAISSMIQVEGEWVTFMTGTAKRKK